jgi:ADP-heptose:LPS heptosyltransferase
MRAAHPEAHIAYLAERKPVSLLEHNPYLNEITPYDIKKKIFSQVLFYRRLHTNRYDLAIDFFGNPRTALLTYATGTTVRLGLDGRTRGRLYTLRIKDDGRPKTAIQFYFQFLRALGVKPTSTKTEIFLTEDERREARTYLQRNGIDVDRPIVVLHSGANWPARVWPSDRFAQLADKLIAKPGAQVILYQGPKDHKIVSEVSRKCVCCQRLRSHAHRGRRWNKDHWNLRARRREHLVSLRTLRGTRFTPQRRLVPPLPSGLLRQARRRVHEVHESSRSW